MSDIGKLLPVDGYIAHFHGTLPVDYTTSLTHLYQPLVGIYAVMLYQTLLEESRMHIRDEPQTHHKLMSYLNIPLDDIYRARLKLEGIGLLKTYQLKDNESNYLYDLLAPFSPPVFFSDAMLSQLLYHHLGTERFQYLQTSYKRQNTVEKSDITVSFQDVFQTFSPDPSMPETTEASVSRAGSPPIASIDFSWLEQMLKSRMVNAKTVLSANNKKLINQMMSLYDLPQYDIEKALLWSLSEDNTVDVAEFKEACHDLFKASYPDTPIQLNAKQTTAFKTEQADKSFETKEEQLIHRMQTLSPKQLLEDFSSGRQASDQDMKIIQEVMTKQGLPAPVMNVLIHYVLLQTNMKLSRNYLEKIASHWSRAKLKNAKEAMTFAKQQLNKTGHQQNNRKPNRKNHKQEVVPEWFKDRKKKKQETSSAGHTTEAESAEDKEDLAELLRIFSEGND